MTTPFYSVTPKPIASVKPVTLALATTADIENPIVGDLALRNGQLFWIDGTSAKVQKIECCLSSLLGEWFLAEDEGFPLLEKVLGKGHSASAVSALYRKALLRIDGVDSVKSVEVNINRRTRTVYVNWSVVLSTGEMLSGDHRPFKVPT
jgi:hypothetical protein